MDEQLLRQTIASNLAYYRKLSNMTQTELAARISYSDKSVSKWERAEGVPDIFVLKLLSELYSVKIDDLLCDHGHQPPPAPGRDAPRLIVLLLSVGLAWLAATVVFTGLKLFLPSFERAWLVFILAIPGSCVIAVVFTSLWWNIWIRFIPVSALIWSVAVSVHLIVPLHNITLIYAIAAVLQVLVILWFLLLKHLKSRPAR